MSTGQGVDSLNTMWMADLHNMPRHWPPHRAKPHSSQWSHPCSFSSDLQALLPSLFQKNLPERVSQQNRWRPCYDFHLALRAPAAHRQAAETGDPAPGSVLLTPFARKQAGAIFTIGVSTSSGQQKIRSTEIFLPNLRDHKRNIPKCMALGSAALWEDSRNLISHSHLRESQLSDSQRKGLLLPTAFGLLFFLLFSLLSSEVTLNYLYTSEFNLACKLTALAQSDQHPHAKDIIICRPRPGNQFFFFLSSPGLPWWLGW